MQLTRDGYARFVNFSTNPEKAIRYVHSNLIPEFTYEPGVLSSILNWYFNDDYLNGDEYTLHPLDSLHGFVAFLVWITVQYPNEKFTKVNGKYPIEIFLEYDLNAELSLLEPELMQTMLYHISPFNPRKSKLFQRLKEYTRKNIDTRAQVLHELRALPDRGIFPGGEDYQKLRKKYKNLTF